MSILKVSKHQAHNYIFIKINCIRLSSKATFECETLANLLRIAWCELKPFSLKWHIDRPNVTNDCKYDCKANFMLINFILKSFFAMRSLGTEHWALSIFKFVMLKCFALVHSRAFCTLLVLRGPKYQILITRNSSNH